MIRFLKQEYNFVSPSGLFTQALSGKISHNPILLFHDRFAATCFIRFGNERIIEILPWVVHEHELRPPSSEKIALPAFDPLYTFQHLR